MPLLTVREKGWRQLLWRYVGFLVALILLFASIYGLNWSLLGQVLLCARPAYLFLTLLFVILTLLAKAARWRSLFGSNTWMPLRPFLAGIVVGQMINNILPGRAGDLARASITGREQRAGYALTLGTLVAEKAMDGTMLLALVVALIPLIPVVSWLNTSVLVTSLAVSAGTMLAGLAILNQRSARIATSRFIAYIVSRFAPNSVEHIEHSLNRISQAIPSNWHTWGWTIGIWVLAGLTNYSAFLAFNLYLPWTAAALLLIVLHLSRLINIAPSQIGIFHYSTILTLGVYGVERSQAFACGLLLHMAVIVPPMVGGAWVLRYEGIYWGELLTAAWQLTGRLINLSQRSSPPKGHENENRNDNEGSSS